MRIKANTEEGRKHIVFLDNARVRYAVEADDIAGWVIVCASESDGRLKRGPNYEFLYEKLTGKVDFIPVDAESPADQ